jgi:hypothetical protein
LALENHGRDFLNFLGWKKLVRRLNMKDIGVFDEDIITKNRLASSCGM